MLTQTEYEEFIKEVEKEREAIQRYESCYADMSTDEVINNIVGIVQNSFVEHYDRFEEEQRQSDGYERWYAHAVSDDDSITMKCFIKIRKGLNFANVISEIMIKLCKISGTRITVRDIQKVK